MARAGDALGIVLRSRVNWNERLIVRLSP